MVPPLCSHRFYRFLHRRFVDDRGLSIAIYCHLLHDHRGGLLKGDGYGVVLGDVLKGVGVGFAVRAGDQGVGGCGRGGRFRLRPLRAAVRAHIDGNCLRGGRRVQLPAVGGQRGQLLQAAGGAYVPVHPAAVGCLCEGVLCVIAIGLARRGRSSPGPCRWLCRRCGCTPPCRPSPGCSRTPGRRSPLHGAPLSRPSGADRRPRSSGASGGFPQH